MSKKGLNKGQAGEREGMRDGSAKAKRRVSTLPRRPFVSLSVKRAKSAGSGEKRGRGIGGEARDSMDHRNGSGR